MSISDPHARQLNVSNDFSLDGRVMEDYRHGALALMDKHSVKPPVYGLTEWERKRYENAGLITPPDPVPVPPKRQWDRSVETQKAFDEWFLTPPAQRYRGLATALARKHGAKVSNVMNRITRWKKENAQHE